MKRSPAFSLIELLIVLGIITLVFVPALFSLRQSQANQALASSANEMTQFATQAHLFSRTAKNKARWGIANFNNPTSYSFVYEDPATATLIETTRISLPPDVEIEDPADFQVLFDKNTGKISAPVTIRLRSRNNVYYEVVVSTVGTIETHAL